VFSFEKENQKTFIRSLIPSFGVPGRRRVRKTGKSLFASFSSEKESLSFSISILHQDA